MTWKAMDKEGNEYGDLQGDKWVDVRDKVVKLGMQTKDGRWIFLPRDMEEYVQAKTASSVVGSNHIEIESRYIGFKLGNNTIRVRVDEKTGNISIEVE
jgi:hypothetical protein